MPVNMIIISAVVAVGLIGFVLVKNDELSGLGRSSSPWRNPHGRLVRTKKLDGVEDPGFLFRFKRTLIPCVVIAVAVTLLALLPIRALDFSGNVPVSLALVLTVVVLTAMGYEEGRLWRTLGMSLIAFILASALSVALIGGCCMLAGIDVSTSVLNAVTVFGGCLGAACGVATLAPRVRFARQFDDGTVSTVEVALDGVAAKGFAGLEDPSWNYKAGD